MLLNSSLLSEVQDVATVQRIFLHFTCWESYMSFKIEPTTNIRTFINAWDYGCWNLSLKTCFEDLFGIKQSFCLCVCVCVVSWIPVTWFSLEQLCDKTQVIYCILGIGAIKQKQTRMKLKPKFCVNFKTNKFILLWTFVDCSLRISILNGLFSNGNR